MENDHLVMQVDKYGCEFLPVRAHNLRNFSTLVESIREKGLHIGRGLLQLKLHEDDRKHGTSLHYILSQLSKTFYTKTTTYSKVGSKRERVTSYNYSPGAQVAFKAAVEDDMYELRTSSCTKEERTHSGSQPNCCSDCLDSGGLQSVRRHCFKELEKCSPYTSALRKKLDSWQSYGGSLDSGCKAAALEGPSRLYGAGIELPPEVDIEICQGFSLSRLPSVLDLLEEDYDGIVYPYFYAGSKHTFFPRHIEDGGTFSINYHFGGAGKLWFGFSPDKFGALDHIARGRNLDLGHTSCQCLLADHKIFLGDPEYFAKNHALCYEMFLQEPGDFILTFPFALHAGVNLGDNLAAAVNYADLPWIEIGMYAPYCSCNPSQVQMDLSPIVQKHRPELLRDYLLKTSWSFLPGHPREVRNFSAPAELMLPSDVRLLNYKQQQEVQATDSESEDNVSKSSTFKKSCPKRGPGRGQKSGTKSRILHCPLCPSSFKENKMSRLKTHIKNKHCAEAKKLCSLVDLQYPAWKPKSTVGKVCDICSTFIRGSSTHLKRHKELAHKNMQEYGK